MKAKRVSLLCAIVALLLVAGCTGTGSKKKMQPSHVGENENEIQSEAESGVNAEESVPFLTFLSDFVKECFWGTNFNRLLRDNDAKLAKYLDPEMDVRRYFSPGAIPYLYTREQNFGFDDVTDFESEPNPEGTFSTAEMPSDGMICELEFNHGNGAPEIYYEAVDFVPDEVYDHESFSTRQVTIPYPNAKIMAVYLPEYYKDNVSPRAFYFIETPNGWKLGFVDDSACSV